MMQQIQKVEQLAKAGKVGRLLHNPARYLSAQAFLKYTYPKTRKGRLETARTFFGTDMEVLLPAATDIYLTGGKTHDSEIRLAKYMIRNLKPGQTYIDVGAHFGYYTLLAATLLGDKGKVYAFEAAGKTYEVLRRNVNNLKQVEALNRAVSNREELITFYEFPILYSEYNSMDIEQFKGEAWLSKYRPEKTDVNAITLDLFAETLFNTPNFIKIDVEGAEDKVIEGAQDMLLKYNPAIIMEYLSGQKNNNAHSNAFNKLLSLGYISYAIDMDGNLSPVADVGHYMLQRSLDSDNIVFIKKY